MHVGGSAVASVSSHFNELTFYCVKDQCEFDMDLVYYGQYLTIIDTFAVKIKVFVL